MYYETDEDVADDGQTEEHEQHRHLEHGPRYSRRRQRIYFRYRSWRRRPCDAAVRRPRRHFRFPT